MIDPDVLEKMKARPVGAGDGAGNGREQQAGRLGAMQVDSIVDFDDVENNARPLGGAAIRGGEFEHGVGSG
jgi:hypothetical protein